MTEKGRFKASEWKDYTKTRGYATKSTSEIYSRSGMHEELDPKVIKIRESRDSENHPNSTAIIVGLDVTGSMSMVLDVMARKGLPTLVTSILDRKPVDDPHIMCMGIGDVRANDRAPLQVTQFEADIQIAKTLEDIWLEGRGGGNMFESYALAWYFAAVHTSIDCFEKRGKKGYLFTVGDERPTPDLTKEEILAVCGSNPERDLTGEELLKMVSEKYEVFHLIVEEGSNYERDRTRKLWTELIGQKAIPLSDHKEMAEVIVSTIQVNEGASKEDVVSSWDGSTSVVVANAIAGLSSAVVASGDVVDLR